MRVRRRAAHLGIGLAASPTHINEKEQEMSMNLRPMRFARRRLSAVSAVATLSTVATFILAAPAMASVPPGHIMNLGTGRCLDSNYNGAVYLNSCLPSDNYQKWHTINDGSEIVDNQTGRCLDANHHQGVFTNPCPPNPTLRDASQYDLWASGVDNRNEVTWENEGEGAWALDANNHQGVFTAPYNYLDRYQTWIGVLPFTPTCGACTLV
jgi:hypothetical protein